VSNQLHASHETHFQKFQKTTLKIKIKFLSKTT